MIDHTNLPVSNLAVSSEFYESVLSCLGMQLLLHDNDAIGFGVNTWEFGIVQETRDLVEIHIAFAANNQKQVQSFHATALEAGGIDNGGPGLRPNYGATYYSAYVIDPDGHNIEAVCR